jgi:cytochrome P450
MTVPISARDVVAPGPRGSLLLGSARDLQRDPLGTFERAAAGYGDVVRLVVGPPGRRVALHLVSHPDGVQQVLTNTSDAYTKGTPFYREIAAYLGDGVLTSTGHRWRQQRRTLAPLFTHRHIHQQIAMMAGEADRLAHRWAAPAATGTPVDLHAEMTEYTLRVVGRMLFGVDVDQAIPIIRTAFPILSEHVRRRGRTPLNLPRHWPTPAQRRAADAQRSLYQVVDAIIDQRACEASGQSDLISLLLAARDPQTGAPLSAQDVRDQILIFLLAGHETTSTALTFTCHLLGHHPDQQRRIHQELDQVLGGRAVTADIIGKLTYTTMVIREALRLYPPGYALGRLTSTGDQIGGYHIPPGSVVILSPWVTHRRPDLWPDPHQFRPDRFHPTTGAARHRYAYFPFAGGPRGCIGEHFAMTEAIIATAVLLTSYTLTTPPAPITLTTGITLRPAGPVPCRITTRHPTAGASPSPPLDPQPSNTPQPS